MKTDLLCLGEPLVEFNQQPDGLYLKGHGGDTSNCAIAAARQGANVGFITHLGKDSFGHSFLELWEQEGIDSSTVKMMEGQATGIYFVTHESDGHHFSYYRQHSACSQMTATDIPVDALKHTGILHVSGISQGISDSASEAVLAAMQIVRKAGGKISYDSNLRLALWPLQKAQSVIHEAMSLCDIALPGLDDAKILTGLVDANEIVDFYQALGPSIVALTLGSEGTLVAHGSHRKLIPAWKVTPVDATAAGDTFDGAFLAELARGQDPMTAASYANATAALATQGYGAVAPIPTRSAVDAFMSEQSD